MTVPLTWLLQRPDLGLRHVTGRVDGVETSWTHAIELSDPSPWLAGGELVLTTGLRMPRSRLEQAQYVDRLVAQGAAGLAFGTGLRWDEIPGGLVDRCESTGLALIEVPFATPFIAISQAVAGRLNEDRERRLQEVVRFQQGLTGVTLRSGLPALATRLARILNHKVAILDETGRLTGASRGGETLAERARQRLTGLNPRSPQLLITLPDDPGVELHALIGRTARRGWLVVDGPTQAEARLLLNHAVTVASLHLDGPGGMVGVGTEAGAVVLGLLVETHTATASVVEVLGAFGLDPAAKVRLCVFEPRALPATDAGAPGRDADRIAARARSLVASTGVAHIVRCRGNEIVALIPASADEAVEALAGLVETLPKDDGLVLGVSRAVLAAQAGEGLGQARRAVRAARVTGGTVCHSDTVGLEAIMADPVLRDRLTELTLPTLQSLRGDPVARELELLRTLAAYLDRNGSWEAAARDLRVHRHTLRSRMGKVRKLTGLDPDLASDRVVLTLALVALDQTVRQEALEADEPPMG